MTELDFDELDKAVNSLMADGSEAPAATASEPTVDTPATPEKVDAPKPDAPAEPVTVPKPATSPLATKRRGQFMDVIHPSSDMKATSGPVKRQGVTITPVNPSPFSSSSASAPAETPKVEESTSTILQDVEPSTSTAIDAQPTGTESAATSPWPDPIDATTEADEKPEVSPIETSPAVEPTETVQSDEPAPLESPFLPDAKPEKRPLGGVPAPELEIPIGEEATTAASEKDAQTEVNAADVSQPAVLPDELHSNIVSIESDTTTPVENTINQESTVESAPTETKPAETTPVNGSIPQQYKEEPSSGDQTNGSIYDTANYHKAIEAHASKKAGSVLKWIIWGLLLLVLGAGGGAAYFMMTR